MLKAYSFIVFILIFVFGCKTEINDTLKNVGTVCTKDNTVLFSQNLRDIFYFKDSSYWIFKDSISGQIDSLWVYNRKGSGFFSINVDQLIDNANGKCYENGNCYYDSRLNLKYRVMLSPVPKPNGTDYIDEIFQIIITTPQSYLYFTAYQGDTFVQQYQDGIVDFIDSLEVNGKMYQNVYRRKSVLSSNSDLFLISYYSKKIGLIKYILNDKNTWELVRYKINQ